MCHKQHVTQLFLTVILHMYYNFYNTSSLYTNLKAYAEVPSNKTFTMRNIAVLYNVNKAFLCFLNMQQHFLKFDC